MLKKCVLVKYLIMTYLIITPFIPIIYINESLQDEVTGYHAIIDYSLLEYKYIFIMTVVIIILNVISDYFKIVLGDILNIGYYIVYLLYVNAEIGTYITELEEEYYAGVSHTVQYYILFLMLVILFIYSILRVIFKNKMK